MNVIWYKRIRKELAEQPKSGTYSKWKDLLSEEAEHRCVYCAIHDRHMGGIRNFHVEHFQPKKKFESKENDYMNLFYACPICNIFKSDDWPSDLNTELSNICYPDPSAYNYDDLFDIDLNTACCIGNTVASKYMVEKLVLNRPQMIRERRHIILSKKLTALCYEVTSLAESELDNQLLRETLNCIARITILQERLRSITPYESFETKRPK